MKIAISSEGADLEAEIGHKFGTSRYLLIVDLETMAFEAVPNPGATGQRGAGVQAVVLAISKDVKAVLTGYCSPIIQRRLSEAGIEVLDGLSGTVKGAIEDHKMGIMKRYAKGEVQPEKQETRIDRVAVAQAIRSTVNQFANLLPIIAGVVLLVGLFNAFVSKDLLSSIFSGNTALDTLWGACFGSFLAGNPVNSYVIGGELLKYDVSLYAVTAFIISWVTVGLVQLPAEIAALGRRFALLRNALCFVSAIPIAILTVAILNLISW